MKIPIRATQCRQNSKMSQCTLVEECQNIFQTLNFSVEHIYLIETHDNGMDNNCSENSIFLQLNYQSFRL